ncbi:MAG: FxSxx-COOH cyclophane-containing RiPP peptide [Actinomycetes bacterium]|jgi:FXSXX-COOH protein|nr:MAG: FXSXX-COOH protein [Actinomycetota bacterium]
MSGETVGEGLLDVTGLSLRDLDRIDRPVLRRAIQRIVDNKDTGPVAGFSSSLDDDEMPQTGEFRSPDLFKS